MPEDEWTISPDNSAVNDAVIHHTERGCVDLLLTEEETLISLQAVDLYITVYHPTEEILSLLRQAVSESGFYIWQTPQIARIKKYESYLNEAQQLLCTGENSDRLMVNAVKVFTLRLCISAYYIHFKRVKVKIFTAFTIKQALLRLFRQE